VLSIVIITRNTRELVDGLLASIEADVSIAASLRETIVVDNGSTDGTEDMITSKYPWATCVHNTENMGFGAAANIGYRRSSGRFVLFLNSDTRLLRGETIRMLTFMEQNLSVGVAAPQLVYDDMRPQRSFALTPSLTLELVPRPVLEALFPRFRTKGGGLSTPLDVASLIGAALMVRRQLLDILDGFDERFFFFLEETDLCLRAGMTGSRVVFFPATRLVHLQGKTVSRSWVAGRIEYSISLYAFMRKYHSRLYCGAFVLLRVCKALLFLLPATFLPFLLCRAAMRRKYRYYAQLLLWHMRRCPADAGLRARSRP
jgi:N-acetylglucosaminyl-diphospho-decaprenol L-rhamnosyltransferase